MTVDRCARMRQPQDMDAARPSWGWFVMALARNARPEGWASPGIGYLGIMVDARPGISFADLVADGRRSKGWTQDDLERESGVSRATLSRWERGLADRPEAEHVRAVCRALDIDPRRAAVALGYLTQEEVSGTSGGLPGDLEEILAILQDPAVPDSAKVEWKNYLKYIQSQARRQAG